jgi:hypothetical protein
MLDAAFAEEREAVAGGCCRLWEDGGVSETQAGKPARRYPRTFGGLIASMIVTVIAVVGYWALQNSAREVPDVRPEPVDYLAAVKHLQDNGVTVAYPPTLPAGWEATSVQQDAGQDPEWGVGILTAEGTFAGVRQEEAALDDIISELVDEEARQGEDVTVPGAVAASWSTWSDEGGDHAFATQLGDDVLVVYGSASEGDLRTLLESLTTAPAR